MSKKKMQKEFFEAEREQRYHAATTKAQATSEADGRGILPFVVTGDEATDSVTGRAGLPLVVEAFRGYRGDDLVKQHLHLKARDRGYSEVEFVEAFCLLMASGGEHLDDFDVLREDDGLERLIDRKLPSPDAARTFLQYFHEEKLIEQARVKAEEAGERSFVPEESHGLRGLAEVQAELSRRMADPKLSTIATLDHDATIIESHKQEATWHYKKGTGYQPAVVVWAEQRLVVADEFRDGNVPAGKDNLRLIKRSFRVLPDWVTERRFRADSACYEERVLKWLANAKREGGPAGPIGFTISADMTEDLQKVCAAVRDAGAAGDADSPQWQLLDDLRADEIVEWAEVEFTPGNWPKKSAPLRYLAVRIKKRQEQLFASGERYKHLAVVTNREGAGQELLRSHWGKAGTIEHVHDETKNGLGGGVLPCAEFGANAAWYRLVLMTYNLLTVIKRFTLPPEQQAVKAKRLRFLVFNLAARITQHARYLMAHLKALVLGRIALKAARRGFKHLRRTSCPVPTG